jgi:tagatose-6-phosphate ketose/aldose isomerase
LTQSTTFLCGLIWLTIHQTFPLLSIFDISKENEDRASAHQDDRMPSPLLSDVSVWPALGGAHTAEEIAQQPRLWSSLADLLDDAAPALDAFLATALSSPSHRVIFTGAGSSGFIAEMVADTINAQWPADVRAVHTTSLLSHPALYLQHDRPTLLVSFGRSGSSPESVAVVDQVRANVRDARFLHITCNADGALARSGVGRDDTLSLLMPPASCDRAFAMTSSLSCMLLAALCVFDRAPWSQRLDRLRALAHSGQQALRRWDADLAALARRPCTRVIYLGSGPLEAAAREAALKLLELTAGRVLALAHTPLGFRHGPKSTVNSDTLVVMLRSAQPLARRYEQDLLDELRADGIAGEVISVGPDGADRAEGDFVLDVPDASDAWLAAPWLLMAQGHALLRSAALGLAPDNPFPDGTVNRVVQGVTIHSPG